MFKDIFNTYKDIVFFIFVIIWIIVANGYWFITGNIVIPTLVINPMMIILFGIITLIKINNKKFSNWLNTPLKKDVNTSK